MKASEEMFDYNCSVCQKKNRKSEAVKHCKDCRKYLCTSCLEQDNDYMEDHNLVEPSDSGSSDVVMPTERCEKHGGEIMKLWCKHHDEVLCNTCAFMDHRSCVDVLFIPSEISTIFTDGQFCQVVETLKEAQTRLVSVKGDREAEKETLCSEKMKYVKIVEEHQEKLIDKIRELGKSTIEEINSWHDGYLQQMEENLSKIMTNENELSTFFSHIETSSENKAQMFVLMKKGEQLNCSTKKLLDEGSTLRNKYGEFQISKNAEECIDSLMSIGSFTNTTVLCRKELGSLSTEPVLYRAKQGAQVNLKISKDEQICDINGLCLLPDGSIMMTDYNNKKLKRLDSSTYKVTDHLELHLKPLAVCCVGQEQVAVSLWDRKMVCFVSVGDTMSLTRSFEVNHYCLGIAYSAGELFVSNRGKNLYVYNLSGILLRTIRFNQFGDAMFSETRHLTISGDRLYICDKDRGLICMVKNGSALNSYRSSEMKCIHGVCTDGHSGVFLCGFSSHNVAQLGLDGEELGMVLTQTNGLKNPQSLVFDPQKKKLMVATPQSDNVLVFELA